MAGVWRRLGCRHFALALTLAVSNVPATFARDAQPIPIVCELAGPSARWIQRALDGWSQVRGELALSGSVRLPSMVLFDTSCVWYLEADGEPNADIVRLNTSLTFAGEPVTIRAARHSGAVRVPDGRHVSAKPLAFASTYRDGAAAYFVMALPDVWRRDPRFARDAKLEEFFLGVMMHEMVHTQHLLTVVAQAEELARQHDVRDVQLDDDLIQTRFESVRGFRTAFEAERDLLFRAAAQLDPRRRRPLLTRALSLARQRRARYLSGANQMYADFEDFFLNMEGAAQWAAYRFARSQTDVRTSDKAVVDFVRATRKSWSQEEGLALFLLLDALVPEWRALIFARAPVSPFALLERAIR